MTGRSSVSDSARRVSSSGCSCPMRSTRLLGVRPRLRMSSLNDSSVPGGRCMGWSAMNVPLPLTR
jgi:hypothetical protein